MAGAEEVVAALGRASGVVYAGLALNERGYDRLVACGLDEVRYSFGATESFNRRNQNASVRESLDAALRPVERGRADGIRSAVTISVAFGCPFEGPVDESRVLELAEEISAARPDTIFLADTIGVGVPGQVRRLVSRAVGLGVPIGGRFHNTRNTGYAMRSRRSRPAPRFSTPRSAGSAAARSPRVRPETSRPRISSTCSTARAWTPGSTWRR